MLDARPDSRNRPVRRLARAASSRGLTSRTWPISTTRPRASMAPRRSRPTPSCCRRGYSAIPIPQHAPSRASDQASSGARGRALAFFDADPDIYDLCFTANTSAAIKLVAESYPFSARRGLALSADNHNSVNGMREFARAGRRARRGPFARRRPSALRALANLQKIARSGPGLFAFPAQSNFSGVRHPLELVKTCPVAGLRCPARRRGDRRVSLRQPASPPRRVPGLFLLQAVRAPDGGWRLDRQEDGLAEPPPPLVCRRDGGLCFH